MELNTTVLQNFIVFEGLDGSGTTTQLGVLKKKLGKLSRPACITCEPTDNSIGKLIHSVLEKKDVLHPESLARLFAADRTEHLYGENGILQNLNDKKLVISDRYIFSSHAYQSFQCDFNLIVEMNRNFPLPQLLIFLDLDPGIGQKRLHARGEQELFDNISTQQKVREAYYRSFDLFKNTGMKLEIIQAGESIESVSENIWEILLKTSIL